jgi:hypothetical protein
MSELNVLISATGEIISRRMARHIIQLALGGCTEQCIPCHFLEVWHRELDQESVSAFLERETEVTDRPVPHGETVLADGRTMVPNGIVSEMVRLAELAESEFIAIYLTLRYPALQSTFTEQMVDTVLMDLDELWMTGPDGNPTFNPLASRRHDPSGHRIGSLPTTPVTPRNSGRPRTSHRTPPPTYSPGRPEVHPRQVLAPIALLERQRSPPPAYPIPPSYAEQDPTVSAEELVQPSNDAIISANEFLENLDYVLQPLGAHAPPPPARHGPWRTRLGPLDRPGRPTPTRMPLSGIEYPRHPEIAPPGQSPMPSHPTLRPSLVSPPLRQRPTHHRRRPPPIITSPISIAVDSGSIPFPVFRRTEENAFQTSRFSVEEDCDNYLWEQGQPRLYMRPSPFSDEFDFQDGQPRFFMRPSPVSDEFGIDFPSPSTLPRRSTTMDWHETSQTVLLSPRDGDEYPESDSSSSFLLDSDLEVMDSECLPDNFVNYRARQREAELQEDETLDSFVDDEVFSEPDYHMLNM